MWLPQLIAYVKVNSGGHEASLLHELNRFQQTFASKGPRRVLGGAFIGAVSALTLGPCKPCPFLMNALLATNLLGQVDSDGMCRFLKPAVVNKVKNSPQKALQAEALMMQSRQLCATMKVPQNLFTKHIGRLDVRLICMLVGQQGVLFQTQFTDIDEVGKVIVRMHAL